MDKYIIFVSEDGTWEPVWLSGELSVQREARKVLDANIVKSDRIVAPTSSLFYDRFSKQAFVCSKYAENTRSKKNPTLSQICEKGIYGDGVIIFVDDGGIDLDSIDDFMGSVLSEKDTVLLSKEVVSNVIEEYRDKARIVYVARNQQEAEFGTKTYKGVLGLTKAPFGSIKTIFTTLDLLLSGEIILTPMKKKTVYIYDAAIPFFVRGAKIEYGEHDRLFFLEDTPVDFPDDELGEALEQLRADFVENPKEELNAWLFDEFEC